MPKQIGVTFFALDIYIPFGNLCVCVLDFAFRQLKVVVFVVTSCLIKRPRGHRYVNRPIHAWVGGGNVQSAAIASFFLAEPALFICLKLRVDK